MSSTIAAKLRKIGALALGRACVSESADFEYACGIPSQRLGFGIKLLHVRGLFIGIHNGGIESLSRERD
jgi:hypothetical protein